MKPKKVRNLSCANVFVWPMLSFYAQVIMFSGDCFLVLEKVNNHHVPLTPTIPVTGECRVQPQTSISSPACCLIKPKFIIIIAIVFHKLGQKVTRGPLSVHFGGQTRCMTAAAADLPPTF